MACGGFPGGKSCLRGLDGVVDIGLAGNLDLVGYEGIIIGTLDAEGFTGGRRNVLGLSVLDSEHIGTVPSR